MNHVLSIGILAALLTPACSQDLTPDSDILQLGEKLLAQAKEKYEKRQWFESAELAERARTAFLAVAELYSAKNRSADAKRPNSLVTECNQLIRLIRDARKAEQEKANPPPAADPKKPDDPVAPPKNDPAAPGKTPADPGPSSAPSKLEPPGDASQSRAEKSIRDTFKADYAISAPSYRRAFARRLIANALDTRGDRVAQYVLFREASDLAAQAGDAKTALTALDEMAQVFAVDALAMKVAMASKLHSAGSPDAAKAGIDVCRSVAAEAVRADYYDIAVIVIRKAEALSRNPVNVTLSAQVQARANEIAELQKEHLRIRPIEKLLVERPDDPAANLQAGRFNCFMKGDWEKGLPLLRKGGDASLGRLVETELGNSTGPELQMDLADAWLLQSQKETTALVRANIKARARFWYDKALPGLSGFLKTKTEARVQELDDEEKSRWSVNLLKLIDPKRDSVSGEWKLDSGALVSPRSSSASILQIPYRAPEEYELKLVAARQAGDKDLYIGLLGGGRQFNVNFDGYASGDIGGLNIIDGREADTNETRFKQKIFSDNRARTILVEVRKTVVTVSVEGRTVIEWKADYRKITPRRPGLVPNPSALFIGDYDTAFRITELWLTPISGSGQKLR